MKIWSSQKDPRDFKVEKKLPKFENNRVQMIFNKNDKFFDLLTNYNSEIFIR